MELLPLCREFRFIFAGCIDASCNEVWGGNSYLQSTSVDKTPLSLLSFKKLSIRACTGLFICRVGYLYDMHAPGLPVTTASVLAFLLAYFLQTRAVLHLKFALCQQQCTSFDHFWEQDKSHRIDQ